MFFKKGVFKNFANIEYFKKFQEHLFYTTPPVAASVKTRKNQFYCSFITARNKEILIRRYIFVYGPKTVGIQGCIRNSVKHLRWSILQKKVNGFQPLNLFL